MAVLVSKRIQDEAIFKIFSGMAKWDSVYFLKIAENGYLYEQYMAFFPLYPVVTRSTANILFMFLQFCLEYRSVLLLSSYISSLISFTFAAVLLYKLTTTVFKNREMAIVSSILFCINPATVFMSGAYTESMFACIQFGALYSLEFGESAAYLLPSVLFGLGSAARSNGIISAGFIAHAIVKKFTATIILKKKQLIGNYKLKSVLLYLLRLAIRTLVQVLFYNGLVVLPFILFQYYGYFTYCTLVERTAVQSPWCSKMFPFPYSYIQDHYWDVGFLRYFELKQIPNFLLAAPIVILSLCSLFSYCVNEQNLPTVKTLGLVSHDTWQKGKRGQRYVCQNTLFYTNLYKFTHSTYMYIHIYIIMYIHTYIHAYIHTRIYTYINILVISLQKWQKPL